jgi:hypothetical protein
MRKNPLIVISLAIACVIVLASFVNVVGINTIESANNSGSKVEVNQKELLFQTIIDIANNREIQKIEFNSEIMRKGFFCPKTGYSDLTLNVLTKMSLDSIFQIGLIISKTISKSKLHSLLELYQLKNQELQKKITAVIEKNCDLTNKFNELSDVYCDCEKINSTGWNFPIICLILFPIVSFLLILWYIIGIILHQYIPPFLQNLLDTLVNITITLNCFWTH